MPLPHGGRLRVLPWCAVTGLAPVTVWTDVARGTGVSFTAYWIVACLLFAAGAALAFRLQPRSERDRAPLTWWALLPCVALGLLAITVQHATSDDAVYLPMVVRAMAHPERALSFRLEYIWTGSESPSWPWGLTGSAYDFLEGALAHATGVPLLWMRNVVAPAVLATLAPLSWIVLAERLGWRPTRRALAGMGLGLALLLLMRESEQAPGCALLLRTCQAKFTAVTLGYPLAALAVLDHVERPGPRTLLRLVAVSLAVAGCSLSATVLYGLALGVVVPAALFAVRPTATVARRALPGVLLAGLYPAGFVLVAWLAARDDLGVSGFLHSAYPRTLSEQAAGVFPGPLTIVASLLAPALAATALSGAGRRFLLAWTLGALVLYASPVTAPFFIERVVTPNVYWRVFLIPPWFLLLPLAGARLSDLLPRRLATPACLAATAVLLCLQIPLQLRGFYSGTDLVFPLPNPDACVNAIAAAESRAVAAAAPPGPVLAPPYLSEVLPLFAPDQPVVRHHERRLRLLLEARRGPHHVGRRLAAARFLGGDTRTGPAALAELLDELPEIRTVIGRPLPRGYERLAPILEPRGFEPLPVGRPGLLVWTRP